MQLGQMFEIPKVVDTVLRESLALEDNLEITSENKLVDLGAEPIDVLDIYHRLGMNFSKYTSGERLNNRFKPFLKKIMLDSSGDYALHISHLADSKTTTEFANKLTVLDVVNIIRYESIEGKV